MTHELDRRSFLIATGTLGAGAVVLAACGADDEKKASNQKDASDSSDSDTSTDSKGDSKSNGDSTSPFTASPFLLGVASGDPLSDAVVIWTRLVVDPLDAAATPSEDVNVKWEVASDARFGEVLDSGTVTATSEDAHSVHVDVEGLDPATEYYYRFKVGEWTSTVGRMKTTPAIAADPEEVRFGFSSCQDFETGYYLAHRAMAADKLDAVIWLGDYIYEYEPSEDANRPLTTPAPSDLDSYRNRYGNYKTDVDLQACHASAPWIPIWDDHETQNNYADLVSEKTDVNAEDFAIRRKAAYKAWWEHMPVRMPKPDSEDLTIYRRIDFGSLMKMLVLDTRQYRDDQPCDFPALDVAVRCAGVDTTQLLGDEQREWVIEELTSGEESTWCVLAQQIMMTQLELSEGDPVLNVDQWDGYRQERQKLIDVMPPNTVVLSGDIHSSWVNDILKDFDDPNSPKVATEFVGPPTSSVFPDVFARVLSSAGDLNPNVKYVDTTSHGYALCTVSKQEWKTEYRYGDITKQQDVVATAGTWTVKPDTPGAVQV